MGKLRMAQCHRVSPDSFFQSLILMVSLTVIGLSVVILKSLCVLGYPNSWLPLIGMYSGMPPGG